jgi:hypothetical protein
MNDKIIGYIGTITPIFGLSVNELIANTAPLLGYISLVVGLLVGLTALALNLARLKDRIKQDLLNKNKDVS